MKDNYWKFLIGKSEGGKFFPVFGYNTRKVSWMKLMKRKIYLWYNKKRKILLKVVEMCEHGQLFKITFEANVICCLTGRAAACGLQHIEARKARWYLKTGLLYFVLLKNYVSFSFYSVWIKNYLTDKYSSLSQSWKGPTNWFETKRFLDRKDIFEIWQTNQKFK